MKTSLKYVISLFIAVAFTITFTNCESPVDSDKDSATLDVSMLMDATEFSLQKTSTANSLLFVSGSVTIREIVFDGDLDDSTSVSITHEQVSTIDLITGNTTPALDVTIPAGTYSWVNLGIEIQDVDATPSVIAEGIYTDANNTDIPLRFEFNSGEVFEAEAPMHTFAPGTAAITQIEFSPSEWFATVTSAMLDEATQVDGVILVNESTNADIFDIVADKLDDATQATFQ
ncbi:MAG: hypothetical protein GF372_11190 [Candidatus Marinimicrobia bacterium]|nr:hypothetical protein [Candidatus Neomarinimicrobiota bacterium]